ncbi:HNH endonuclease signature motif containing protein [Cupriavidus campinensis]|uniref:HNH endonuclease n=1 Tax=Cupriavidus campinensis TaxID=151783 RepID=A0ABY3EKI6_9BURK|nr:HNH endonuclease signature motif containing protein [Cupriavidus campinensis]TSP11467.1 HNH endonuclease [Cupriavidus campinensis]
MASVNKADLERLYLVDGKSIPDLANALDINYSAARKALISAGIALRSRADGVRLAAHKLGKHLAGTKRVFTEEWKANIRAAKTRHGEANAKGISHKADGYVEITRGPNKGRGLHVVLMEQHLGRRISENEVVHHRDENKHNNDLTNLEVMTRAEHARLHRLLELEKKNGKR